MSRSYEPPSSISGMVANDKKHPEERSPGLNTKKVAGQHKANDIPKGIWSELSRDHLVVVQEISNKGMERKPETCTKVFLIQSQPVNRVRVCSILGTRKMQVEALRKSILSGDALELGLAQAASRGRDVTRGVQSPTPRGRNLPAGTSSPSGNTPSRESAASPSGPPLPPPSSPSGPPGPNLTVRALLAR